MKKSFLLSLAILLAVFAQAQDAAPENTHIVVVKKKIIKYGKPNEVSQEYKMYKMTDEAWTAFKEDGLKKDLAAYGNNVTEAVSNTFTNISAKVMTPPPPKNVPFDGYYYMDHVATSGNCYVIYKNKEHEKKGVEIVCKITKKENLEKLLEQVEKKNKYFDSMVKQECIE